LHLRTQGKVKIRQPLSRLYVRPKDAADKNVLENPEYVTQILDEANVKQLQIIDDEESLVKVRLKPDIKKIGPRAGRCLGAITEQLRSTNPKSVSQDVVLTVDGQPFALTSDEILLEYEAPGELQCGSDQGTFMALDKAMTPELIEEGLARDFNRLMQNQRKILNLDVSDRIRVRYSAGAGVSKALATHEAYLKEELLAEQLEAGEVPEEDAIVLSLSGERVRVTIRSVSGVTPDAGQGGSVRLVL
jgi:isoleucyl-tRNA synthetase